MLSHIFVEKKNFGQRVAYFINYAFAVFALFSVDFTEV